MIVLITALGGVFSYALGSLGNTHDYAYLIRLGAIVGAIFAIVGSLFSYYAGGWIIANISDARAVEHYEDPVLFNVVQEMAIAAGIPPPKIYAIAHPAPNAFATGRDPEHAIIGITTGLRKMLDRDELQAVIAHEMAHIKNYDTRLMMLVGVYAGIIVLMSDYFIRIFLDSFRLSGRRRARSSAHTKSNGPLLIFCIILAIILAMVAPLIARLMRLAVSREREYLADATAVQLCRNPVALASALEKLGTDKTEESSFANRATEHMFIVNPDPKLRIKSVNKDSIWSTHPPLIRRIARIKKLAGEYIEGTNQ